MGGGPSDLEVFFENFSKIQISTMVTIGQRASKYITKRQFKRFLKIFLCLRGVLKMLKKPRFLASKTLRTNQGKEKCLFSLSREKFSTLMFKRFYSIIRRRWGMTHDCRTTTTTTTTHIDLRPKVDHRFP